METFLLTFIPLFVAIDSVGTLPFYMKIVHGYTPQEKRKLSFQAVLTAFFAGLTFTIGGRLVFRLVGITPADFQIAGGLLLLVFSIQDLFGQSTKNILGETPDNFLAIVPLGIPIIAGPAMITTLLVLGDHYNIFWILLGLAINLLITHVLYIYSDVIIGKMGEASSKVIAKVFAIFLAAIGIMMIRRGLEFFLS